MPKPTKGARLGGSPAHQKLMLANLATSLFAHGRITTTEAKARRLRPFAEKLVTHAKHGDLHHRREVMKIIRDKSVVHTLFADIGPLFAERPGGYTRIIKTMPRKGDNAPMAIIELLQDTTVTSEADRARRVRTSQKATAAPAGAVAAGESAVTEPTEVEVEVVEETPVPAAAAQTVDSDDERADEAAIEQEVLDEETTTGSADAEAVDAEAVATEAVATEPVVTEPVAIATAADADLPAEEQVPKDSPS